MIGFDSFNSLTIIGRLGGDLDVKFTQGGNAVANFSVATKKWNQASKKSDLTLWFRCSSFDKTICEQGPKYFKKGDVVQVTGEVDLREYEKDGVKHASLELKTFNLVKIGGGKADNQGDTNGHAASAPAPAANTAPAAAGQITDDDIPF